MTSARRPTGEARLLVIAPPSSIDPILRAAVQQAALARGLTFRGEELSAATLEDDHGADIVFCADASRHPPAGGRRIVVFPEEGPEEAAQALAERSGLSARDALIVASRCYAAASSSVVTGALRLEAKDLLDRPLATFGDLFDSLGVPAPSSAVAEIRAPSDCAARCPRPARTAAAPFRRALAMYARDGGSRDAEAWWDRALFRWGDHPELECPETMDVTGPARMLAFGPFITLPAGRWRAELHFDVCADAARRFYLVEFGTGADLSRRDFRVAEAKDDRLAVEHTFAEAAPAEIRFWVARAAFHGHLGFRGAKIIGGQGDRP